MSCLVGALWCATAAAQSVELDWEAPAECPSKAQAEAQISALLDAADTRRPAQGVAARVAITQSGGRYRLRLRIASGSHRAARELQGRRCEELVEVAAWLVALAVDPALPATVPEAGPAADDAAPVQSAGVRSTAAAAGAGAAASTPANTEGATERAGKDTRPSEPSAARSDDGAARDARQPERSEQPVALSFHAGGSGGLFAGSGVDAQGALSAFAALGADWSYTQLRITAHLPRSIEIGPDATAQLWSLALNLSQCALWGDALRAGPCGVLTGIRTRVEASGVSGGDPAPALWATAGAGLLLLWRIHGHLELSLASHVGLPISPRPRFSVAPLGPVVSAEPWSVDAELGLAFSYP